MMVVRYVDLFAGIGGFRAAADAVSMPGTKLDCVGHSEIDSACSQVYRCVWPASELDAAHDDVRDVDPPGGLRPLAPFDLLLAGFPCQSFANIGRRRGFSDPRGALFYELVDLIEDYQPPLFVLENVAKLAVLDRGEALAAMVADLAACGYHVVTRVAVASDFGLPQARRRMFFFGVRRDVGSEDALFDQVAGMRTQPLEAGPWPTTWHVLDRTMPVRHLVPEATRRTVLRPNPRWQGRLCVNPRLARPITATMAKWHRANQDSYFTEEFVLGDVSAARFDLDVDQVEGPVRRITPREALRLQGFGVSHIDAFDDLGLAPTPSYRLIGNAVPVPMATAAIEAALACLR